MSKHNQKLIIAGPCAAESKEQVIAIAQKLKNLGVVGFRACLWKPRTKPGFEGVGIRKGAEWLGEVAKLGMISSTEVLLPQHARALVKNLVRKNPKSSFLFWIGSRNQNHLIQREIGSILKQEKQVFLMLKNQVWRDKKHWIGIYEHIVSSGFPKNRILICHRGFDPNGHNPRNLRNIPDYQMAMEVRLETGRMMIFDPSHIGGERNKVIEIFDQSLNYEFDGYLIETHNRPDVALTDAKQQLTVDQLADLLLKLETKTNVRGKINQLFSYQPYQ